MLKPLCLLASALFLTACTSTPEAGHGGMAGMAGMEHHAGMSAEQHKANMAEVRAPVNLILLYKLKDGVKPADFEAWVRSTDYPGMRSLKRVADFRTHRVERPLMGADKPTVQYIETFSIADLDGFMKEDMAGQTVQSVMGAFMGFAEAPQFLIVSEIK
ncbi:MAG TPA: hypothetical protein PK080_16600 [Hyphomonadaceae bacterium]|nr:hypothetical protein [Hyphomonadaceae bacterium]